MKLKLALVFLILLPTQVMAGVFSAKPIRIFMDAKTKMTNITVYNSDKLDLTLQMKAVKWGVDEKGSDTYEDTNDIIIFPKQATVKPDEALTLRVGIKTKKMPAREATYRIYIQELPVSVPGEKPTVKMALRLSLPIFYQPLEKKQEGVIESVELKDEKLVVRVKNSGNVHFLVSTFKVTGLDSSNSETFNEELRGWYVLNNTSKDFYLDIPKEGCEKSESIQVEAGLLDSKIVLKGSGKIDKEFCPKTSTEDAADGKPTENK